MDTKEDAKSKPAPGAGIDPKEDGDPNPPRGRVSPGDTKEVGKIKTRPWGGN